jgi:hypothetical protein
MKTWIKTSIAAALLASTTLGTSVAMARGGHCDGQGPAHGAAMMQHMSPEQMAARMQERVESRLARLELALVLQPGQQAAWTQFKGALLVQARDHATLMAEHFKAAPPSTAAERLQRMEAMHRFHQAELADVRRAVEAFYPALGEAQKKVFDDEFHPGAHGMGMHGMHKMHGMHGGRGMNRS